MRPQTDHAGHFADNRANWDDRAAFHEASGYGLAELLASPDAITRTRSHRWNHSVGEILTTLVCDPPAHVVLWTTGRRAHGTH